MNGMDMWLLRRRLRQRLGMPVRQFRYQTVRTGIETNSRRLADFIDNLPEPMIHLVGHSLGGVLALQTLRRYSIDRIGRVVCLGSPFLDSVAARNFSRFAPGRAMVGRMVKEAVLDDPVTQVDSAPPVGVIAGTVPIGLGLLVGRLQKPHDGMVRVTETRLPEVAEHLCAPVNHIGLEFSARVADQTANFLREGVFSKDVG
jgi:pimeloyl-ACP methyl ester carboxylesterase